MQGWCERKMSCAAREVLLKSVVQALPAYSMSCFKLTKGLCKKLTTNMSKYLWAGSLDKRGMHWQAWEKMAIPESKGGMGFRDMTAFNQAVLAKQAWSLLDSPDSLCASLLKTKYYPDGQLLDTVFPNTGCAVWKGILHGLDFLKRGVIWRVGNGAVIRTWRGTWIPDHRRFAPSLQKALVA